MKSLQPSQQRSYRYLDLVMVAFVTVYLCSNLIGPAKAASLDLPLLGQVTFGAGVLFFPHLLCLWRHSHRGLRLRASQKGHLDWFCCHAFCVPHGLRGGVLAASSRLEQPGSLRNRFWKYLAHCCRIACRLLRGRICQLLLACQIKVAD